MNKFVISGFSDEIDENIEKQFSYLKAHDIKFFEPRGVDGKNVADLNNDEVLALKEKMDEYGIKASSIGSPIGKIQITDDFDVHIKKLKRVIEISKMLGTKYIRVFSFFIPNGEYEKYRDEVIYRMKTMTALAEKEKIVLLHENEKGIYGDMAERCLEIVKEVNSPSLRCVFDPANFVQCNQKTYPNAYEILRPYIEYMHIKDALPDGTVVPASKGEGRVEEILKHLYDSGYCGFLSIEPHLGAFTGLEKLEQGDEMLALEKSSEEKFTLAYESLMEIVERILRQ